jgi:uncharacterized membrane protein YhaH (DUF805 family)
VTRNPYAPPGAPVEDAITREAVPRHRMPFWAAFYLSPAGRTGRRFYWLCGFLPFALLGFVVGILRLTTPEAVRYVLTGIVLLVWPQAVVLARRFHDLNLSGGWVAVLWLFPGALVLLRAPVPPQTGTVLVWLGALVLGLMPGTRGPNRYGNDPRR